MSAKTSPKRDALRDLLKDWFVANPNTPIDSKKLRELFGEDQQPANTVLGQVHNRVNSGRRWRYAERIGCDSVDGTFLRWPTTNLPRLRTWINASDQLDLFAEAAA